VSHDIDPVGNWDRNVHVGRLEDHMRVLVRLDTFPVWEWHVDLVSSLASRDGFEVHVDWVTTSTSRIREWKRLEGLFALERRLHGVRDTAVTKMDRGVMAAYRTVAADDADVVLDLSEEPGSHPRSWWLEYDGHPGGISAVTAVLEGRTPVVTVVSRSGGVRAAGRPGSELPGVAVVAFGDLLAGCATLIRKALAEQPFTYPPQLPESLAPARRSTAVRTARAVANGAAGKAYRALYRAPHWRVGWRFVDGADVLDLLDHPGTGWRDLRDDGHHFYADPFPVEHLGRHHLFVEDYDHRQKRGVISVVEFGPEGPLGVPYPVLEHEVHLSYPHVLATDGEIWMVPETSGAGTIELYRAVSYPDRWIKEAILVDGVEASDATVFEHAGSWWMTATVRHGGAFSDSLHVWYAPRITGPWTPHHRNPLLVDIATARPAGRVVNRGGRLLRPVQDGRRGYGASLAIMEITALDEDRFDQRLVGLLGPDERWPGRRLHTLNRAGRLECIDGSAYSPRHRHRSRPG
jgi:hypothetical protein